MSPCASRVHICSNPVGGPRGRKISERGVPVTRRFPLTILIAVACFLVMYFWGETIVGWMTR